MNHLGQITQYTLGNNRINQHNIQPNNYLLQSLKPGCLVNLTLSTPANGTRKQNNHNVTETLHTDIQQLTSFKVANNNLEL
jgi:hypothetical protein